MFWSEFRKIFTNSYSVKYVRATVLIKFSNANTLHWPFQEMCKIFYTKFSLNFKS